MSLLAESQPKRRGQGTIYTEEIAEEILERIAEGELLEDICDDPAMPAPSTVRRWAAGLTQVPDWIDENGRAVSFQNRYARANQLRCEVMASEILTLSDTVPTQPDGTIDSGVIQKARLQCDNRRWLLSKLLPKTYGDKVTAEITGDPDQPIVTRIELVAVRSPARIEDSKTIDHTTDVASEATPKKSG